MNTPATGNYLAALSILVQPVECACFAPRFTLCVGHRERTMGSSFHKFYIDRYHRFQAELSLFRTPYVRSFSVQDLWPAERRPDHSPNLHPNLRRGSLFPNWYASLVAQTTSVTGMDLPAHR